MIRKLMASTALVALVAAGSAAGALAKDNSANAMQAGDAMQAAQADTGVAEKLVPEQPTLASAFIDTPVYAGTGPDAALIGDVNDLIVADNGAITDAVIGVGGFLGIGEKNVAVPFDKLQVVENGGVIRLIYSATRQQLEDSPAVDLAAYDPAARFANQVAAADTKSATQGTQSATPDEPLPLDDKIAAADDLAADGPVPAADLPDVAQHLAQTAWDETSFQAYSPDQIRASLVIGQPVYGPDDDNTIGTVSDLIMADDGKTRAALVDVGGFLGVGGKTIAIPFTDLRVEQSMSDPDNIRVAVDLTKKQLEEKQPYAPHENMAAAGASVLDGEVAPQPIPNDVAATDQAYDDSMSDTDNVVTGSITPDDSYTLVSQNISARDLLGATVYGVHDQVIGDISDVVFGKDGRIDSAVIDVGGFLGVGQKPVAVNFDRLKVRTDNAGTLVAMIDATQKQLENAPTYEAQADMQIQ